MASSCGGSEAGTAAEKGTARAPWSTWRPGRRGSSDNEEAATTREGSSDDEESSKDDFVPVGVAGAAAPVR